MTTYNGVWRVVDRAASDVFEGTLSGVDAEFVDKQRVAVHRHEVHCLAHAPR